MTSDPLSIVPKLYSAIRTGNVDEYVACVGSRELAKHLNRVRRSEEDLNELEVQLHHVGLRMPPIAKIDNREFADLIMRSYSDDDRMHAARVIGLTRRRGNRGLVKYALQAIADVVAGEPTSTKHPILTIDGCSFVLVIEIAEFDLAVRCVDGQWLVSPYPYGLIPFPGYAGVVTYYPDDETFSD